MELDARPGGLGWSELSVGRRGIGKPGGRGGPAGPGTRNDIGQKDKKQQCKGDEEPCTMKA